MKSFCVSYFIKIKRPAPESLIWKKNYDNKWDIGKISEIKINFNL